MSYHVTASDNDTTWLVREAVPQSSDFNLYSYKFNDMLFGDSQTLKIVLRMFMDFDLLNKFSIPHKVGFDRNERVFTLSAGRLPVGAQCEEELSSSQVPQLATRTQCVSDYVHCAKNRQNGTFYGGIGGAGLVGG